jgi:hypothetical protein
MYSLSGGLIMILITMVVEKVRERLAISKQAAQDFDVERFNLKKQSELEVRKQYELKI